MDNMVAKSKKPIFPNTDRAILLDISDQHAEYLTTVARTLMPTLGGAESEYEGFCFIGRDRKTQKLRATLTMHTPKERLSATFQSGDVEDLERFVHSWANHTLINQMVQAK
jgi:hypothetical protein